MKIFCRRTYGPALDRFAERNFGISPSDDYEDTEEDKELRAFSRRMYGPSIDKYVEREFGLSADGNPLASSSASKDASKAVSWKKKKRAQTAATTLKRHSVKMQDDGAFECRRGHPDDAWAADNSSAASDDL